MKPIHYDLCQVAMIFYFANCLRKANDPPITLASLELVKQGRGYTWNQR
jgi:hypothetical protein